MPVTTIETLYAHSFNVSLRSDGAAMLNVKHPSEPVAVWSRLDPKDVKALVTALGGEIRAPVVVFKRGDFVTVEGQEEIALVLWEEDEDGDLRVDYRSTGLDYVKPTKCTLVTPKEDI